jgi:hypothetical protein
MGLAMAYFRAKESIIEFADEWDWQENVSFDELSAQGFLSELGWVIINSGFRASVARKVWPGVRDAFRGFENLEIVSCAPSGFAGAALRHFGNLNKINAIADAVNRVYREGWDKLKARIAKDPIKTLREFQYIGPITSYHLAKNIGFPVAKPDRHLMRLASLAGYDDVQTFCNDIANETGDTVPLVDMVLWRFAEQTKDYQEKFKHYMEQGE